MTVAKFLVDALRDVISDSRSGSQDDPPDEGSSQSPEETFAMLKLALEQAQRREVAQFQRLEATRTRAGTLIGIAGIGAAFVSSRADTLSGPALYVSLLSALLFLGTVLVTLMALSPQRWEFGVTPESLVVDVDKRVGLDYMYRDMVRLFRLEYDHNQKRIEVMLKRFNAAAGLLVLGLFVLVGGTFLAL